MLDTDPPWDCRSATGPSAVGVCRRGSSSGSPPGGGSPLVLGLDLDDVAGKLHAVPRLVDGGAIGAELPADRLLADAGLDEVLDLAIADVTHAMSFGEESARTSRAD